MKLFSLSSTIVADASVAIDKSTAGMPANATVYHPPGTLLDMPDDEATRLIETCGCIKYDAREHGTNLRQLVATRAGGSGPSSRSIDASKPSAVAALA